MSHGNIERNVVVADSPAAFEVIQGLGAATGSLAQEHGLVSRPAAALPSPDPNAVLEVALEALRFEHAHAHAEAARSRTAGLLTACGVLLALTAGLGSAAAQAAQKLSHLGAAVTVCAAASTAVFLLAAAAISGHVGV